VIILRQFNELIRSKHFLLTIMTSKSTLLTKQSASANLWKTVLIEILGKEWNYVSCQNYDDMKFKMLQRKSEIMAIPLYILAKTFGRLWQIFCMMATMTSILTSKSFIWGLGL